MTVEPIDPGLDPGLDPGSQRPDPELDAFLADVTGAVEADLGDDGGFPDFAAVVAMAHQLDAERVPQHAVAEVADYAPVVPLAAERRRRSTRDDVAMAAFVAEVRAAVDVDVAEAFAVRASTATPPPSVPAAANAPAPVPSRRVWGAVLALAAAVLLVGGGVVSAVRLSPAETTEPGQAALQKERASADEGEAELRDRRRERSNDTTLLLQPEPELEPVVEPEPEEVVEPPVAKTKTRRPPRPSLDELDAAARAAWSAGDRSEAQRLFKQVVARGGRGKLAEMAYGDMMAIARQQGAPSTEAKLWRGYLKRFPKGVFADDAQAGLCRRASGDKARACWQRYLETFPKGTHVRAAKAGSKPAASTADATDTP